MSWYREHVYKPVSIARALRSAGITTAGRPAGWTAIRRAQLKKQGTCEACGRSTKLEVHHIRPYKNYPWLALDPDNLCTLCANGTRCHITFGHLGNYKRANKFVAADAETYLARVKSDTEFND